MEMLKAKITEVTTCDHNGSYSISTQIENAMITVTASPYIERGLYSRLVIFDLQPDDMYELANKIIQAANKIRKVTEG